MSFQERRRHPRVAKTLSLQLTHQVNELVTETTNVSESGAHCTVNRFLPLICYEMQPAIGLSIMKHNLKAAGVIRSAAVRPPTRSLDPKGLEELEEIRRSLAQAVGRPETR